MSILITRLTSKAPTGWSWWMLIPSIRAFIQQAQSTRKLRWTFSSKISLTLAILTLSLVTMQQVLCPRSSSPGVRSVASSISRVHHIIQRQMEPLRDWSKHSNKHSRNLSCCQKPLYKSSSCSIVGHHFPPDTRPASFSTADKFAAKLTHWCHHPHTWHKESKQQLPPRDR